MAVVGDVLLEPEATWKRYDDRNPNINYVGAFTMGITSGYYMDTHTDSSGVGKYYEFYFYGTKLRIIDAYASNRSRNVRVTIDEEVYNYDAYNNTTSRTVLVFEKLDLELGFHKVRVENLTTGYMTLDAIDIDDFGELRNPISGMIIKNSDKYYSLKEDELLLLPDESNDTILNYGIEMNKETPLNIKLNKIKDIQYDNVLIGNGKVYTHKLNLKNTNSISLN